MAEKIISPGVFTNEIDQSFLPAAIGDIGAAVVGPTVKGPILVPTVVNNFAEFERTFGVVVESGSKSYQFLTSHTAREYLKNGGPLTVVRVADGNFTRATASISKAGNEVAGVGASGSIKFATGFGVTAAGFNNILEFDIVGAPSFRFEYKLGGSSEDMPAIGTANHVDGNVITRAVGTGSNLAGAINEMVNAINLTNVSSSLSASNLSDTHLVVSSSDGTAITQVLSQSVADDPDTDPDEGNLSAFLNAAGLVPLSGEAGSTFDTSAVGSTLMVLEALGDGPIMNSSSSLGTNQLLTPLKSSATNDQLVSGHYGGRADNIRYEISAKNNAKGTFTLLIRQGNDTINKKQILETHANLTLDENDSQNFVLARIGDAKFELKSEAGVSFLEPTGSYANRSAYVRIKSLNTTMNDYLDANGEVANPELSASLPATGSGSYGGSFSGGSNGTVVHPFKFYETITAGNSQGINMATSATAGSGGYRKALSLLANADEYDFNLLLLPGVIDRFGGTNHNKIITDAINMCEARGDAFLIVDNVTKGTSITDAKNNTEARNTSYAAAYYPWIQVQDVAVGTTRFVPPSVVLAGVYAFNDKVAHPWFAPAGLNRGGIDSAIQATRKLTNSMRDDLYESNVNPIATFPGQGVSVFGQKTMQKKASALDRVNVRRLLINVKKFIASTSRFLVFEQNNAATRGRFLNIVNPFLEQVQSNSGLNAFRVVMDESNNTPDVVDRNILFGQLFLQPTRTAEFIVLDFTIQPTGASFPE